MADDLQSLDVKRVMDPRLAGSNEPVDADRRRRQKNKGGRERLPRETKDYFRTIAKAAEKSNDTLRQRGAPLRFRVYEESGDVLIDLVKLDAQGNVAQTTTRTITHQDFDRWIQDVAQIEGLFLDTQG